MSSITSTIPTTMPTPFAPPGLRRITVDEYERIIRAGALNDPDRVELIDGYLVDKMGKSAEHGYATKKIIKAVEALLPAGWTWRTEQPVRIPDYDEPEPDVTIVRGTDEDYEHRIPDPDDVGLLIEVSLTTLDRDLNEKLPAPARLVFNSSIVKPWPVQVYDQYPGLPVSTQVLTARRLMMRTWHQSPEILDYQGFVSITINAVTPVSQRLCVSTIDVELGMVSPNYPRNYEVWCPRNYGTRLFGFKSKPDNGFDMTPGARRPQEAANAARWNCQVETLGRFTGLKRPPRL